MIIKFRARGISQSARKMTQTFILIKKINTYLNDFFLYKNNEDCRLQGHYILNCKEKQMILDSNLLTFHVLVSS